MKLDFYTQVSLCVKNIKSSNCSFFRILSLHFLNYHVLHGNLFVCHDKKDQTVCFNCGTKLVQWQEFDDPWFEHAKFTVRVSV